MPFYPGKILNHRHAQNDIVGAIADHTYHVKEVSLGSPVVDDTDRLVVDVHMFVGAYTIAAQPDVPRNVTCTCPAADGAADTLGTVVIVGTDRADRVITETITPVTGNIATGTMAFKTITSITHVGWVIGAGNDHISFGVGGLIGLPDKLAIARPIMGILNGTVEAVLPAMTVSATVLALNTVDFTTAWGGTAASFIYLK